MSAEAGFFFSWTVALRVCRDGGQTEIVQIRVREARSEAEALREAIANRYGRAAQAFKKLSVVGITRDA